MEESFESEAVSLKWWKASDISQKENQSISILINAFKIN